jgi:hypothetical protein
MNPYGYFRSQEVTVDEHDSTGGDANYGGASSCNRFSNSICRNFLFLLRDVPPY